MIGCDNAGGDNGSDGEIAEAGWYKYVSDVGSVSSTHYFYINSSGSIERVGTDELGEFSEDDPNVKESLQRFKNTMNYKMCRDAANNSNGMITFQKCDTPSWAEDMGDEEIKDVDDYNARLNLGTKYATVNLEESINPHTYFEDFYGISINDNTDEYYKWEYGTGKIVFTKVGKSTLKILHNKRLEWDEDMGHGIHAIHNDHYYTLYVFTIIDNAPDSNGDKSKLVGTWSSTSDSQRITFNADGTGNFHLLYEADFNWHIVSFSGTNAQVSISYSNQSSLAEEKICNCTFYNNFTEMVIDFYVNQTLTKS